MLDIRCVVPLTFVALAFVAGPSLAAEVTEATRAASVAMVADHAAVNAAQVASPSVHGAFATESAAQIRATRGDSSADIRLSKVIDMPSVSGDAETTSLALVASAPLASGGGNTTLASLDGLAGGTTIGLQFSVVGMRGAKDPKFSAQACKDLLQTRFNSYELLHPDAKVDDIHCDATTLDDALTKGLITQGEYRRFAHGFWSPSAGLWSGSLTAKAGYVDSTWYDPATLAKTKGREDQWSVSGQFGWAWLNQDVPTALVATLSAQSAQSAPKDASSRSTCLSTPPTGQTLLTCANGPIGAPARKTTQILSIEARAVFSTHYAAELQASRDFRNHLSAVHIPMYFIPSDKTGLSGGIVLGWTSDDHKVGLGVFVGQSFSVL